VAFVAGGACSAKSDTVSQGSSKPAAAAAAKSFEPVAKAVKTCYRPGERATVVTSNAMGANLAYVPVYADGLARADTPRGDANAKGIFRGSWVIPTDVPPGPAKVRIAAAGPSTGKQIEAPFTVADASGKCTDPSVAASKSGSTVPGQTTVPGSPSTTSVDDPYANVPTTIPEIAQGGDFATTVTVTKQCLNIGEKQTVKVQTKENALVSYVLIYREGSQGNNSNAGLADPKGHYEDTFIVDPLTKNGTATVQVVAKYGKQKSFNGARFKVGDC
jgi:hypothetical protein